MKGGIGMQKAKSFSKKIILVCLSFAMLLSCPLSVYSAVSNNNGQADLMYTTIEINRSSISISGIKASCNAKMTSKKSTTLKIKME